MAHQRILLVHVALLPTLTVGSASLPSGRAWVSRPQLVRRQRAPVACANSESSSNHIGCADLGSKWTDGIGNKVDGPQIAPSGFEWSRVDDLGFVDWALQADTEEAMEASSLLLASTPTMDDETLVESAALPAVDPPVPTLAQCFAFIFPALGIYVAPSLLSLIDAAIVGRDSSVHLAALGPSSTISDSAPQFLLFLSIASTNLVARATAAGDERAAARAARSALGMAAVAGSILGALMYAFATPLSTAYCGSTGAGVAALVPLSATYIRIRALALPAAVMGSVAQAVCIGTKDARSPLLAVGSSALFNLCGDLVLVCGLGRGIAGAAWATTGAQYVAVLLLLRVLAIRGLLPRVRDGFSGGAGRSAVEEDAEAEQATGGGAAAAAGEMVGSILSFAPLIFVMSMKNAIHNTAAATSASLGGAQAAAHTALFATGMLCFMIGDVGSSLCQAFLPAFLRKADGPTRGGDRDSSAAPASPTFDLRAAWPTIVQLLRSTLVISASVVALATGVLTVGSGLVTHDPDVAAQILRIVPLIAVTLSLHGTAVSLEGLLMVKKDFATLCTTYAAVGASFIALQWLTRRMGWGLIGVWSAYIWLQIARVAAFTLRSGLQSVRK